MCVLDTNAGKTVLSCHRCLINTGVDKRNNMNKKGTTEILCHDSAVPTSSGYLRWHDTSRSHPIGVESPKVAKANRVAD